MSFTVQIGTSHERHLSQCGHFGALILVFFDPEGRNPKAWYLEQEDVIARSKASATALSPMIGRERSVMPVPGLTAISHISCLAEDVPDNPVQQPFNVDHGTRACHARVSGRRSAIDGATATRRGKHAVLGRTAFGGMTGRLRWTARLPDAVRSVSAPLSPLHDPCWPHGGHGPVGTGRDATQGRWLLVRVRRGAGAVPDQAGGDFDVRSGVLGTEVVVATGAPT